MYFFERSQNTVLLASTQAVYKAPHSTVRQTDTETYGERQTVALELQKQTVASELQNKQLPPSFENGQLSSSHEREQLETTTKRVKTETQKERHTSQRQQRTDKNMPKRGCQQRTT